MAAAWQQGVALPPAGLIRVGAVCVVRDGHLRNSVATTYAAKEIEALVTGWELAATPGEAGASTAPGANRAPNAAAAQPAEVPATALS